MAELTAEALAEATDTSADRWVSADSTAWACTVWTCAGEDADGVPSWRVDAYGVTATVGVLKVEFDDHAPCRVDPISDLVILLTLERVLP